MSDFRGLLATLVRGDVEFIIVGGVAATIHGSSRLTVDVDVVYGRSAENRRRLVSALAAESPYLRDAPKGLPFRWDESTLARGLNFMLTTRLGEIDLLGEIPGGGTYEDLLAHTIEVAPF